MTVREFIERIGDVPESDLRTLRQAIDERLRSSDEHAREEAFARLMETKGLIRRPDRSQQTAPEDRPPLIEIGGEPLSETIIRERR